MGGERIRLKPTKVRFHTDKVYSFRRKTKEENAHRSSIAEHKENKYQEIAAAFSLRIY